MLKLYKFITYSFENIMHDADNWIKATSFGVFERGSEVLVLSRVNWYVQSEENRLVQLSKSRGSCGLGYNSDLLLFLFWSENAIVLLLNLSQNTAPSRF